MLRNARYYLAHLLNGPAFRFMVARCELEATLILSLLQSIGHYQLSHFFEDYAIEQRNDARRGRRAGMWKNIDYDIPTDKDLFPVTFDWHQPCSLRGDYDEVIADACVKSCERLEIRTPRTLKEEVQGQFSPSTSSALDAIYQAAYCRPEKVQAGHLCWEQS